MTRTAGTVLLMFTGVAFAEPPIKPTLVSWEGKETPAIEVIDSIAKQAGIAIDRSTVPADKKVNLEFKSKPFWEAVFAIAESVDCRIATNGKGGQISFVTDQKKQAPHESIEGPFCFTAKSTTAKFDYETAKKQYRCRAYRHAE